jgi:hypothetical protein
VADLDTMMRQVLAELELVAAGRTTSWGKERVRGGDGPEDLILSVVDAPHLYYRRRYTDARDEEERAAIYESARLELDSIRVGCGDPTAYETLDELYDRIVETGEGWPATDVAAAIYTTPTIVARAREARGREPVRGFVPPDLRGLPLEERRKAVRQLFGDGLNGYQIAKATQLSYDQVRRDLGWKT